MLRVKFSKVWKHIEILRGGRRRHGTTAACRQPRRKRNRAIGNWNFIVGANEHLILDKINISNFEDQKEYYGKGNAGKNIIDALVNF